MVEYGVAERVAAIDVVPLNAECVAASVTFVWVGEILPTNMEGVGLWQEESVEKEVGVA